MAGYLRYSAIWMVVGSVCAAVVGEEFGGPWIVWLLCGAVNGWLFGALLRPSKACARGAIWGYVAGGGVGAVLGGIYGGLQETFVGAIGVALIGSLAGAFVAYQADREPVASWRPWRQRWLFEMAILFAVVTMANAAFWARADFQQMTPPSIGTFEERATYFGVTELGPFAMLLVAGGPHDDMFWAAIVIGIGSITALATALRSPNVRFLRVTSRITALAWPFWGFAVAALRIT